MERNTEYNSNPVGAKSNNIPQAELSDVQTSIELIANDQHDSSFFRNLEKQNIKLNKPQIEAVRHFKGTALVLAGAGSGKTSVLTCRTAYLLSLHHVDPKSIMLLTFTSKAANEMKDRIASLPGLSKNMVNNITAGTFHSIFYRLLKSQGYDQKVLSNEKQKHTAIKIIMKKMNLEDTYQPEELLSLLSAYKINMIKVEDIPEDTPLEKEIKEVFKKYEDWKTDNHYIDFDDMLLETYYLLLRSESLLNAMQQRFQFLLVDEFQDTNPLQYELIKMIASPHSNLFVVGDDDQTIFQFQGAKPEIILNFDRTYQGTKVITLDTNYRCTQGVLGLGNEIIKNNTTRHNKTLKGTKTSENNPFYLRPNTTDDEASNVVECIISNVKSGKRSYKDFAILHRTLSNSRAMFEQLVLKNIPFIAETKGDNFYDQSIVKPVVDYLRISINPKDFNAIEGIISTLYMSREKTMDFIWLFDTCSKIP
jgi:DNA helicase-2/ATP-dependent DNA helicase PcrA